MTKIIGIMGPEGTFKKFETVAKCAIIKKDPKTETVIIDILSLPKEEDFNGLSLVLVDPKSLV
jgi:hypothetical protein